MDRVAVSQCAIERFEDHSGDAVAEHRPGRTGIEGATVPVGRRDAAFLVVVATILRERD